jgi:hypothetical protein
VGRRACRRLTRALTGFALVATGALAACGDGGGEGDARGEVPTSGCDDVHRDRIDPGSANHVLAGGDDPGGYTTDPPTSGPHIPGDPRSGVLDEPLSRPEQVGHLEAGGILLQHRGLDVDDLAVLESLAGGPVAVAPNPDLPAPIVATAWLHSLACTSPDLDVLAGFVEAHRGRAPGTDG